MSFEALVDEFDDEDDAEADVHVELRARAFLASSDWTVGTILDQVRQGNIDLDPLFQRRSVWDDRRASRFIESVFLGLPIPQIVLAEDRESPGKFIVLDGKQRLLTLLRFAEPGALGQDVAPLRLSRLDQLVGLSRMAYSDLVDQPAPYDVRRFINNTIRTVVIAGWPNEDYLNLVFLRLNSGSVPLSGQELRQALNPGGFTRFINSWAADSGQLHAALRVTGPDFRMRDTELALRFVAFAMFLPRYRGDLKGFLDSTTQSLNADWLDVSDSLPNVLSRLTDSIERAQRIHGTHAFRRYRLDRYEGRFNRAVFDTQTLCYAIPSIAHAADSADDLEQVFRHLCVEDRAFSEAISATTKSIDSTFVRLDAWTRAIAEHTGRDLPRPILVPGSAAPHIEWRALADAFS